MTNATLIRRRCEARTAQEPVTMEWARINDHEVIIVTEDQNWLRQINANDGDDPFAEPMSGPGSKATTRQLLDAAWCAGVASVELDCTTRRRSLPRYVRELIGSHYLTSASPGLLREMAVRFREAGRGDLEKFASRFARLEDGDQQMAADDLSALGYSPEKLVASCSPPAISTVCRDCFTDLVRSSDPIDAFGYIYAVERSSLSIDEQDLQEMASVLPPGVDAMRCRRHHSGVGGDVAHVKYFIHVCSRLPGPDRARIARATFDAITFITSIPTDDDADDTTLEQQYSKFRLN